MSIFGKIMSAIFGTKADAASGGGATAGTATSAGPAAGSSSATASPAQTVDVAPILDKAVAAKKEKLEWRTSIVDLIEGPARHRLQSRRTQGACQGTRLHWRQQ